MNRSIAAALMLLVLPLPLRAAETLTDAWTKALRNDAGLAAAALELQAAQAGEKAARGARWPAVETGATYSRYAATPVLQVDAPGFAFRSPPIFDNNDAVVGFAQVTLPLYAGGSIGAAVDAAHSSVVAANAIELQTRADVKLGVAAAYFNVLRAGRALQAAQRTADALAAHYGDVGAMVERQLVSNADLLAARVALANAEQQRLRAANDLQLATARYNQKLGEPAERAVTLAESNEFDAGIDAVSLPGLLASALAQRSELTAVDAQAASRKAQARAELGKALPQLALVAQYSHVENTILDRQDLNSVAVGFKWNLFDAGQARNRAASLRRDAQAMQVRAQDLRSQIELQVREAWLSLQEARGRILATRDAVAAAEENLRTSRELYGAGLAANTQVLDAVALAISATNNRDDALLDAEFARLRLARAVGNL